MMLASHSPSQINLEHEKQARYIEKPEEKIDFSQNEKMLLDLDISSKTEDDHGRNNVAIVIQAYQSNNAFENSIEWTIESVNQINYIVETEK